MMTIPIIPKILKIGFLLYFWLFSMTIILDGIIDKVFHIFTYVFRKFDSCLYKTEIYNIVSPRGRKISCYELAL
jgi:hypothetical protein